MGLQLRKIGNKKGQADFISLFFVLVVLFGVSIFAIILYNAYDANIKDNLNDALTSSTPVDSSANITKILDQTSGGIRMLNPLFPLLLVGLFGFGLVMALMGKSHPAFFFVGIIILAVSIILAVVFSNAYESITQNDNFVDSADEFQIMSFIMGNLPLVIFILFLAISAVLYGMRGGTPSGGAY
ncbi:MAG: hypothetical protein DRP42_03715 [Tenericutes bacterium]|nr:MAG: hypothetical protein DRP42_03715 [Mycoplasmatota bacterium]